MEKEKTELKLIKLKNYKGAVAVNWKPPKTNKALIFAIRKLLKLFYRCESAKLLTGQLIDLIKQYAEILKKKGLVKLVAYPELVTGLKEIEDYKHENLDIEVVQEKIRESKREVCSVCGVTLVKPAYLVHRKGLDVVYISAPIGIRDLNAITGKLQDLISELNIEDQIKEEPKEQPKEDHKYQQQLLVA